MTRSCPLAVALLVVAWASLPGCASTPGGGPDRDPLHLVEEHLPGSPLNPADEEGSAPGQVAQEYLGVTTSWTRLPRLPRDALQPLPTGARLLVHDRQGKPFEPTTRLGRHARWAPRAQAEAFLERVRLSRFGTPTPLGRHVAVARLGSTLAVRLEHDPGAEADIELRPPPPPTDIPPALELRVFREPEGDRIECAVVVEGWFQPEDPVSAVAVEEDDVEVAVSRLPPRREVALLEALPPEGTGVVFLLPSPFRHGEAMVLEVAVHPADIEDDAVAAAIGRSEAAFEQASLRSVSVGSGLADVSALVQGLDRPWRHRATLALLASTHQAPLTGDVALLAQGPLLASAAETLRAALVETPPRRPADLALAAERASVTVLAQAFGRGELEQPLQSALLRHAGEVGRQPTLLKGIYDEAPDLAGAVATVENENRIFLEDPSPSARVRAFDWLLRRDLAPAGYDPLSDRAARRAALEAARTEQRS